MITTGGVITTGGLIITDGVIATGGVITTGGVATTVAGRTVGDATVGGDTNPRVLTPASLAAGERDRGPGHEGYPPRRRQQDEPLLYRPVVRQETALAAKDGRSIGSTL